MSRARDFADLAGSADAGGITGRNMVVNGAMQVAQRSTSVTGITTTGYRTVDRYQVNINAAGTWSISQSTTAPTGFANSLKMDCTTADASLAAGDYVLIKMHIEGQDLQQLKKGTADAEAVTASFWVRSAKTGTYTFEIVDGDNSRTISASYTISAANTWEYKTITFPGDTTGTLDNDANSSFQINWWLAAGTDFTSGTLATAWASQTNTNRAVGNVNLADSTSNDWYMTGFQLEVGEVATPFEHRSYGDELRRCQRYYQQIGSGYGKASSTSAFDCSVTFNPPMRTSPTVSDNGTTVQITNIVSADFNQSSASCADTDSGVTDGTYGGGRVRFSNFSGLTGGETYAIDHNSSHGGAATFDAEL